MANNITGSSSTPATPPQPKPRSRLNSPSSSQPPSPNPVRPHRSNERYVKPSPPAQPQLPCSSVGLSKGSLPHSLLQSRTATPVQRLTASIQRLQSTPYECNREDILKEAQTLLLTMKDPCHTLSGTEFLNYLKLIVDLEAQLTEAYSVPNEHDTKVYGGVSVLGPGELSQLDGTKSCLTTLRQHKQELAVFNDLMLLHEQLSSVEDSVRRGEAPLFQALAYPILMAKGSVDKLDLSTPEALQLLCQHTEIIDRIQNLDQKQSLPPSILSTAREYGLAVQKTVGKYTADKDTTGAVEVTQPLSLDELVQHNSLIVPSGTESLRYSLMQTLDASGRSYFQASMAASQDEPIENRQNDYESTEWDSGPQSLGMSVGRDDSSVEENPFSSLPTSRLDGISDRSHTVPAADSLERENIDQKATVEKPVLDAPFTVGDVTCPGISKEQARVFFQKTEEVAARERNSYPFYGLMNETLDSLGMPPKTKLQMVGSSHPAGQVQDFTVAKKEWRASAPLKHSQIKVDVPKTGEVPLAANTMTFDGRELGIAMRAPSTAEMPAVLEMARSDNPCLFVDLMSDDDRVKYKEQALFNWNDMERHQPVSVEGGYELSLSEENTLDFAGKVGNAHARARIRKINVQYPNGPMSSFVHITFPDWPDGKPLPVDVMEELHQLVDRTMEKVDRSYYKKPKLLVNCHMGVGRTGSFFVTRHLRDKAARNELDSEHIEQECLRAIIQAKMSRNIHCVQFANQASMVKEAAQLYNCSHQYCVTPGVIGPYQPAPVTPEIAAQCRKDIYDMAGETQSYDLIHRYGETMMKAMKQLLPADDVMQIQLTPNHRELLHNLTQLKASLQDPKTSKEYKEFIALQIEHAEKQRDKYILKELQLSDSELRRLDNSTPYAAMGFDSRDNPRHRCSNMVPQRHNQVTIQGPSGYEEVISGSHLQMGSNYLGIARQVPHPTDALTNLQAIREHNVRVVVDLVSNTDRNKHDQKKDDGTSTILNWDKMPELPEGTELEMISTAQGICKYDEKKKREEDFTVEIKDMNLKASSGHHDFTQISCPNWPDGHGLPIQPALELLHTLISAQETYGDGEGNFMINCMAGMGRTGQLFSMINVWQTFACNGLKWEDITHYLESHPLKDAVQGDDLVNDGMLATESIIHGRMSRNGEFVQSPSQAQSVFQLETLCRRVYEAKFGHPFTGTEGQ